MIKVLYITESGIAVPYLTGCLQLLESDRKVVLEHVPFGKYNSWKNCLTKTDVLIYQSLRSPSNPIQDDLFLNFNKPKFLFDSCDIGSVDRFAQFSLDCPRIKNTPHVNIMHSHNIVLSTTFPVRGIRKPFSHRDITISFRVKMRNNVRQEVRKLIDSYSGAENKEIDWIKKGYYPDYLTKVLISVNAPGNGEACIRHLLTLQAGACMLAHESINGIKLLPNADLIDGEDYISFNLSNLHEKLDWLLSHRHIMLKIASNGESKFKHGYSQQVTADKLLNVISNCVV